MFSFSNECSSKIGFSGSFCLLVGLGATGFADGAGFCFVVALVVPDDLLVLF